MSKERLERVKSFIEAIDNYHSEGNERLAGQTLEQLYQECHIDWLTKQAERAEQNKNDWLNTMKRLENYEKVASLNHEEIQRLREQNKRYREAIERALERLKGIFAERYEVAMAYTELTKALGSEPDE